MHSPVSVPVALDLVRDTKRRFRRNGQRRGRTADLPIFRSGVADAQLRGRCGSVDGCRRVPLAGADCRRCRRCRHRCRQLAGPSDGMRGLSTGPQSGPRGGSARRSRKPAASGPATPVAKLSSLGSNTRSGRWPASSRNSVGLSCCDLVLVCESAEDLSPADPVLGEVDLRWPGAGLSGCELAEGAVRPAVL
jgi:hypothetical protein